MNAHLIERHFAKIGARAKVDVGLRRQSVAIDIGNDVEGEYFDGRGPASAGAGVDRCRQPAAPAAPAPDVP